MLISPLFVKLSIESGTYFIMSSSNEFYFEPCSSEELDTMLADRHQKQNTKSIVAETKKKLGKVAKECAADKKKKMAKTEEDAKKFKIDLSGEPERPPISKTSGRAKKGGSSKYEGVNFMKDKKDKPWKARIRIDGTQHCIGHFKSEKEAGIAYAQAVFKYRSARQKKSAGQTDAGDESSTRKGNGGNAAAKKTKKKSVKMQRMEVQQVLEDMQNNSSPAAKKGGNTTARKGKGGSIAAKKGGNTAEKTKKRSAPTKQRDGKAKRRRMYSLSLSSSDSEDHSDSGSDSDYEE